LVQGTKQISYKTLIIKVLWEKRSKTMYSKACVESGPCYCHGLHRCSWGNHSKCGYLIRKGSHSAFAVGLPDGSLFTVTDSGWIKKKYFYGMIWLRYLGPCLLLLDAMAPIRARKL